MVWPVLSPSGTAERVAHVLVAAALAALGCSGNEFSATEDDPCDGGSCAGSPGGVGGNRSSGGAGAVSSGGARNGGAGGGAGIGGGAGTPSSGGAGGISSGGSSNGGSGGVQAGGAAGSAGLGGAFADGGTGASGSDGGGGFPITPVLDDFNRPDGDPGLAWIGSDVILVSNQSLACGDCGGAALWAEPFGANQEAFATLSSFGNDAAEINLVLKAQESQSCELIEILYSPSQGQARIDYCVGGTWTMLGPTQVFLEPGDQFGGRAHADGTVEIFVNGRVIATVDASAFPYGAGRVGVNGVSGDQGLGWDDFGGGNWK